MEPDEELYQECKYWTPVKAEELTDDKYITKFGGSNPFRNTDFKWPKCDHFHGQGEVQCEKQKYFYCQINISELPEEMKTYIGIEAGMFQVFYCTGDCLDFDIGDNDKFDLDIRFIPREEMIPSLKTLAAVQVFKKNLDTGKLPELLVKFVNDTNEDFDWIQALFLGRNDYDFQEEKQIQMWREKNVDDDYHDYSLGRCVSLNNVELTIDEYESGRHPDPLCRYCGLVKDIMFLYCFQYGAFSATITLCPGCGEPGTAN